MTTGLPAASLAATWGSDPIDWAPPFGVRHGTRLKISLADFATSLTLSIAFEVRLFGGTGSALSVAATLPAPVVWATGALDTSGLAGSDLRLSVSAACWAAWARAGSSVAGTSSKENAANVSAINDRLATNIPLKKASIQKTRFKLH